MKTTNVSRKICAALIGAGILGSAPLFGANFDKTVNEGESFSKQQNDVTGSTVEGSAKFEDGAVIFFEMADSSLALKYWIFTDADFSDNVLFEGPDGYELDLEGLANGTIGFVQVPEPAVMAAMAGFISLALALRGRKKAFG